MQYSLNYSGTNSFCLMKIKLFNFLVDFVLITYKSNHIDIIKISCNDIF